MNKQQEIKLKKMGIFTLPQAEKLGLNQQKLSRLGEQESQKHFFAELTSSLSLKGAA